jgi:DNA-binding NarL/FixJ family response regulator
MTPADDHAPVAGFRLVEGGFQCVSCGGLTLFKRATDHKAQCPTIQGIRGLTDREREVCLMISRGFSTKDIARERHMSVNTVETHRYNAMRKLGIRHAGPLTRLVIEWEQQEAAQGRKPKRYFGEPEPGEFTLPEALPEDGA